MSTSILYHAFGLKGVHYESSHFFGDCIYINARMTDQYVRCTECRHRKATFKGQKRRLLRMIPIGRKKYFLDLLLHRLKCLGCGHLWWPTLPFMDGKHRYVRSFALSVLDLLKFGTIRSVAEYRAVGWDLVKQIHKDPKLPYPQGKLRLYGWESCPRYARHLHGQGPYTQRSYR